MRIGEINQNNYSMMLKMFQNLGVSNGKGNNAIFNGIADSKGSVPQIGTKKKEVTVDDLLNGHFDKNNPPSPAVLAEANAIADKIKPPELPDDLKEIITKFAKRDAIEGETDGEELSAIARKYVSGAKSYADGVARGKAFSYYYTDETRKYLAEIEAQENAKNGGLNIQA